MERPGRIDRAFLSAGIHVVCRRRLGRRNRFQWLGRASEGVVASLAGGGQLVGSGDEVVEACRAGHIVGDVGRLLRQRVERPVVAPDPRQRQRHQPRLLHLELGRVDVRVRRKQVRQRQQHGRDRAGVLDRLVGVHRRRVLEHVEDLVEILVHRRHQDPARQDNLGRIARLGHLLEARLRRLLLRGERRDACGEPSRRERHQSSSRHQRLPRLIRTAGRAG